VDVDLDMVVDANAVAVVCLDGNSCTRPRRQLAVAHAPKRDARRYRTMFGFQRLDVYSAATEFLATTTRLVANLPKGHGDIADQLRRAALSVPLNIAEGSGKFSREAVRFYTIARGSALECAAILDVMEAMAVAVVDKATLEKPRELLERVVAMLTGLIRP
jgi:four helix bundle protein